MLSEIKRFLKQESLSLIPLFFVVLFFSYLMMKGVNLDEEAYRFSIISSWFHINALMQGYIPFWFHGLGLGIPHPFGENFIWHPLTVMFAIFPPPKAIKTVYLFQGWVGAIGFYFLARHLKIKPLVASICSCVFVLSSPFVQTSFRDLFPTVFTSLTMFPWVVLFVLLLMESRSKRHNLILALLLGISVGFQIINGHTGHCLVYYFSMIPILVIHRNKILRQTPWFMLAITVSILIALPHLFHLVNESRMFPEGLGREGKPYILNHYFFWNIFERPLTNKEWLVELDLNRGIFMGGLFAMFALFYLGVAPFIKGFKKVYRMDMALAFLLPVICLLLPLDWFRPVVSASVLFRDPLVFFGILCAGLFAQFFLDSDIKRQKNVLIPILFIGLSLVFWGQWPNLMLNMKRYNTGFYISGYVDPNNKIIPLIKKQKGRLYYSMVADKKLREHQFVKEHGLNTNSTAFHGIPTLNGWFKGIATSDLHPDWSHYFGQIKGQNSLLADNIALDVLNVGTVIAERREKVAADLKKIHAFEYIREFRSYTEEKIFQIFSNDNAWGPATFVKNEARNLTLLLKDNCEHNRFLCSDFSPLPSLKLNDESLHVNFAKGKIHIQFAAQKQKRTILVSEYYRPEWRATANGEPVSVIPLFGSLIGVDIPADANSVVLSYVPLKRIIFTLISLMTLISTLVVVCILFVALLRKK